MMITTRRLALAVLVTLSAFAVTTQASWYNPVSWFAKEKPYALIVTTNYLQSRLLAELIQHHTGQPVLLLPTGKEKSSIYVIGPDQKSFELKDSEYKSFVETLHPQTVVFLGNETYAPQEYVDQVKEGLTVTPIRNDDWVKIAKSAGDLLKIDGLGEEYQEYLDKFDYKGRVISGKDLDQVMQDWNKDQAPKKKPATKK